MYHSICNHLQFNYWFNYYILSKEKKNIFLLQVFSDTADKAPLITIDIYSSIDAYNNYLKSSYEYNKEVCLCVLALALLLIMNPGTLWIIAISLKIKYNVKKYDIHLFSSIDLQEKILK